MEISEIPSGTIVPSAALQNTFPAAVASNQPTGISATALFDV